MKQGLIITLVATLVLGFGIIGSYFSFSNTADGLENTTRAQYQSNQNTYDAMWKTIQEVAQVPSQYKDDFKDLLATETSAKFGPNGSQAMMQWFQERELRLPPEMYTKVQTVIEANREKFRHGQDMLLDKQRRYRDHLAKKPGAYWASWTGHPKEVLGKTAPKEDLDGDGLLTVLDWDIVTSAKTKAVFDSGEDNAPVNVFGR